MIYTDFKFFRWVWRTWGWNNAFQHDAYSCEKFNTSVGWPTQRLVQGNNFVGSVILQNVTLDEKCPVPCRRKPDWEYC